MSSSMREQLACAAGFFNGEGSTHAAYGWKRKDGSVRYYVQLSISQSGENGKECLEQFRQAVGGVGKIYGPRPPARNQKKVCYEYEVNGYALTRAVITKLWSWLSTDKRVQATNALRKHLNSRG